MPDFDRKVALDVLIRADVEAASRCPAADDPHGSGRIVVNFINDGRATSVAIEASPGDRDIHGTKLGKCIEETFCACQVPVFGGAPVTVHKSFHL